MRALTVRSAVIVSVVVMDCGLVLIGRGWVLLAVRNRAFASLVSLLVRILDGAVVWCGGVSRWGGDGASWCVMVSHGVVVGRRWCVVVCHGESLRGGGAAMVRQDKTVRETRDDSEMRRETRDAVVPRNE